MSRPRRGPLGELLGGISDRVRSFAEFVDGTADLIAAFDKRTCDVCRFPFNGRGTVPAECDGEVCSDCCARTHNHNDRTDTLGET